MRTPPKVPRPVPAPLAESPTIAAITDAESFWAGAVSPLIEPDGLVTFLWRDDTADQVLLFVNRITDERNLDASLMRRVPGTDIWHLTYRMGPAWRASYAVVPHTGPGAPPWLTGDQVTVRAALDRGRRDPLNPLSCVNRQGVVQSVVSLDGAPVQPWLSARTPPSPAGAVTELAAPSGRRVWWYEGPGAAPDAPLVLAWDGAAWLADLPTTLDNLAADGLGPVRAVLVDAGDREQRWSDLDGAGGAVDWVVDELLPWASARTGAVLDPRRVVTVGQSLGALTSLQLVLAHPDRVGVAVSQSASLWREGVLDLTGSAAGVRVYLEVGLQEWVLLEPNRRCAAALVAAGADVHAVEYDGGHDQACWRGGVADGLAWFLRGLG